MQNLDFVSLDLNQKKLAAACIVLQLNNIKVTPKLFIYIFFFFSAPLTV